MHACMRAYVRALAISTSEHTTHGTVVCSVFTNCAMGRRMRALIITSAGGLRSVIATQLDYNHTHTNTRAQHTRTQTHTHTRPRKRTRIRAHTMLFIQQCSCYYSEACNYLVYNGAQIILEDITSRYSVYCTRLVSTTSDTYKVGIPLSILVLLLICKQ